MTEVRRLLVPAPVAVELRELLRQEIRMAGGIIAGLPSGDDPTPVGEQYRVACRRLSGLAELASRVGWETPYPARTIELEGDEECDLAIEISQARMDASGRRGIIVLADLPTRTRDAEMGAAYLAKYASSADVLTAVRLAAEDEHTLGQKEANLKAGGPEPDGPDALTPREKEVLEQLRSPEPYTVLAARLHIAPNTFKVHARHVRDKLGVRSRLDLVDPEYARRETDIPTSQANMRHGQGRSEPSS